MDNSICACCHVVSATSTFRSGRRNPCAGVDVLQEDLVQAVCAQRYAKAVYRHRPLISTHAGFRQATEPCHSVLNLALQPQGEQRDKEHAASNPA